MKLYDEIKQYIPFNDQEKQDQQFFLSVFNQPNILLRDNLANHITASCWIVNQDHSKVLMIYHNIYQSWSWIGGHADGCEDQLSVAIKEMEEESGIKNYKLVQDSIFSIETCTVDGHIKRGKYVNSHLHLNVTYLFEVDENETLILNDLETSGVKWIPVDQVSEMVSEKWMMDSIYSKLIQKVKTSRK